MKKIELNKSRLQFNRERVATLTSKEMKTLRGGATGLSPCGTSINNECLPPLYTLDPTQCYVTYNACQGGSMSCPCVATTH